MIIEHFGENVIWLPKIVIRERVTILKQIRDQLQLRKGDHVALIPSGSDVILQSIPNSLLDLQGSVFVSAVQDFVIIWIKGLQEKSN